MEYEKYDDPIRLNVTNPQKIVPGLIRLMETGIGEPLYPGDERRIFVESLAAVFVQLYNLVDDSARQVMLKHARGEVLDALGERLGIERLQATPATTILCFELDEPRDTNIIIPSGTKATTDGSVYFATDHAAVLQAGTYAVDVSAHCLQSGSEHNGYTAGQIKTLVDLIPWIARVYNCTETLNGDDGEPYTTEGDDRLRERIRLAPAKRSTAGPEQAYKYWAMTADADIVDAAVIAVVEKATKTLPVYDKCAFLGGSDLRLMSLTVYKPDGTEAIRNTDYSAYYTDDLMRITLFGPLENATEITVSYEAGREGEVKIIPLCAEGQIPTKEILDKVQEIAGADDVRPMTDKVHVQAPEIVWYDIDLTYWAQNGVETDVIETVEGKNGAIEQYAKWQAESIGENINPDQLKRRILSPDWDEGLIGALRVQINRPSYTELKDYQVARWSGVCNVDHYTTAR